MINNAKRNTETIVPRMMPGSLVPLPEALVRVPLPLPGEIVTAAVSPCDNEGAWKSGTGGGRATKNARCGKQGSMVIS